MHQEAYACGDRRIIHMLIGILEEIWRWFEAMTAGVGRVKSHLRKQVSYLQLVVSRQQVRCLLDQPHRFLTNTVIVQGLCAFSFGKQTKQVTNAWRPVAGPWRRIIDQANETVR